MATYRNNVLVKKSEGISESMSCATGLILLSLVTSIQLEFPKEFKRWEMSCYHTEKEILKHLNKSSKSSSKLGNVHDASSLDEEKELIRSTEGPGLFLHVKLR